MKYLTFIAFLFFTATTATFQAQVVLNELAFGGSTGDVIELKNTGTTTIDVSNYWFFTTVPNGFPTTVQLGVLNLACGDLTLEPDEIIAFDNPTPSLPYAAAAGELILFTTDANGFADPNDIADYVAWGLMPLNTIGDDFAQAANQWQNGDFVQGDWQSLSIEYDGDGNSSTDWVSQTEPTICEENEAFLSNCIAVAGTPSISVFNFCVGDGIPDHPEGLTVSGNVGAVSQWVVTEIDGTILEIPDDISTVDFEGAPGGICAIWHVSHDGSIVGLEEGMPILMMSGCHEVSSPTQVFRDEISGGLLEGGPFDFCIGDGVEDFVSNITLTGNVGLMSKWVVTDELGMILDIPNDPTVVNFDLAPEGVCLIWHLSHFPDLTGLDVGLDAHALGGCHQLSNPITVNRFPPTHIGCSGGPSYVIVGFDDLNLERSVVHQGGVGVVDENGRLDITDESDVTAEGTFVNSPDTDVDKGARASNIHAIPATPTLPDFLYNPTETTNDDDIDVLDNETVVLTEAVYEDIDVEDGATIIFSGHPEVFIEELETKDDVTVLFDQCTNLIIKKRLTLGKYNNFNSSEENVFVFAEGDARIKKGSTVFGVIYSLKKLRIQKAAQETPTLMYGLFIGEDAKAQDYSELWSQDFEPCSGNLTGGSALAMSSSNGNHTIQQDLRADENQGESDGLAVYPNPAEEVAYVTIDQEGPVQLDLYDLANRLIRSETQQYTSGTAVAVDVRSLPVGVYWLKITSGEGSSSSHKLVVAK